ncbi:HK97-gp10 family putative phage morphogenesis protein [Micromonospora sp. NPDC053740]|uniref:HK97-gp10 family putative phage morphogenesis protein n=1 Tax=Micromonospora sp. NPDC053740 TaxID=3155173 RepID=UPI00342F1B6F
MDDFDGLADDMDGAGDKLGRDAHDLVRSATLRTEHLAKARAPVLTGHLRSSISSDFDGGPGSAVITGETGPTASYAHFLEHGTSRMAPQPFLNPAADVVEPQFYAAAEMLAGQVLDG